jgi:hypothetical protein
MKPVYMRDSKIIITTINENSFSGRYRMAINTTVNFNLKTRFSEITFN